MFKININTENAAFCDPYTGEEDEFAKEMEIERIMSEIKNAMSGGYTSGSCIDINGNKVGTWSIK